MILKKKLSQKDIILKSNEKTNSEHFSTASIKLHKWADDKLNEINQSYEIYKSEFLSGEKNYKEEELIIKSLMLLDEIYHNINIIQNFDKQISKSTANIIKKHLEIDIYNTISSEDDLFMVYNYHIKNIIFDLVKLKELQGYNL